MMNSLLRRAGRYLQSSSLAVTALIATPFAIAQQPAPIQAEGYITAVQPPSSFSLNGIITAVGPDTAYGSMDSPRAETGGADQLHVGAYVQVDEIEGSHNKPPMATTIRFRDPNTQKLRGVGVIMNVISSGSEPVFEADGYRIRITGATQNKFAGGLTSFADVGAGSWIAYEGERDKNGTVIASKTVLFHPKQKKGKAQQGKNETGLEFKPPVLDNGMKQDGEVHLGVKGTRRVIPADAALQDRIARIGERVVPAYQKALPAGNPAKLNFRFYAIVAPKDHKAICSNEGLILIPTNVIDRLKSDDEVAAVLADGVATLLQRQQADASEGVLAGLLLLTGPAIAIPAGVGLLHEAHKQDVMLEEQRARDALALVSDAGYDPWQAPEAWRLIDAKKLPKDMDTLKYPNAAAYQLGVLSTQYPKASPHIASNSEPAK